MRKEINEILEQHKIWLESFYQKGARANLENKDLKEINFRHANLKRAILRNCDLRFCNFSNANLNCCDFSGSVMQCTSFVHADASFANFDCVELRYSNLEGMNLYCTILPASTFVINGEKYFISITNGDCIRACNKSYLVDEWRNLSEKDLLKIDGQDAVEFYPRLLDIIDFYCGKGGRPAWLKEKAQNNTFKYFKYF